MIVIGIDPGLSGALAAVKSGNRPELLGVTDIPTTGADAKRRVDVASILEWVREFEPHHAFIERAQAMPDQGASSGFHYGRAVGALEACIEGLMIPLTVIESTAWKKLHGLIKPSDVDKATWSKNVKENSRQRALRLFPGTEAFSRKKDHNRAESALIAYYGLVASKGPSAVS